MKCSYTSVHEMERHPSRFLDGRCQKLLFVSCVRLQEAMSYFPILGGGFRFERPVQRMLASTSLMESKETISLLTSRERWIRRRCAIDGSHLTRSIRARVLVLLFEIFANRTSSTSQLLSPREGSHERRLWIETDPTDVLERFPLPPQKTHNGGRKGGGFLLSVLGLGGVGEG